MQISIDAFITWACDTFGLYIHDHQLERIKNQIKKYIEAQDIKPNDLLNNIKAQREPYYSDLVDIVTVQESYFFRDQNLFLYLKNNHLPALLAKKKNEKDFNIRVWSAASSMGEELYSIAMLFYDLIEKDDYWQLYFLGTDINTKALSIAREGLFRLHAMRATTTYYKEKYFDKINSDYQVKTELKRHTHFQAHNLNSPIPPESLPFDIIICRNALIYFSKETVQKVLALFKRSLTDDGCLFLGPSDLITYQSHGFTSHQDLNVFYLSKQAETPATAVVEKPTIKDPKDQPSFIERMRSRATDFNRIKQLLERKDYERALLLINPLVDEKKDSVLLHRYHAQALIGLGDNVTALESLKKAVKLDSSDPKTHYFMGLCYIEEGHRHLAINALNTALSIKPEFPEANHALALLLLNDKQLDEGIKTLMIARDQARTLDADAKVLASNETMLGLANIIEKEISYYKDFFK